MPALSALLQGETSPASDPLLSADSWVGSSVSSMSHKCKSNRQDTWPSEVPKAERKGSCACILGEARAYGLAEDGVTAVLQAQVGGDGGRAVLHEQEDHGLLGFVAHHGHTVCECGQQRVKGLTPFTCPRETACEKGDRRRKLWKSNRVPVPNLHCPPHCTPTPSAPNSAGHTLCPHGAKFCLDRSGR